jgi:hypothetical protein
MPGVGTKRKLVVLRAPPTSQPAGRRTGRPIASPASSDDENDDPSCLLGGVRHAAAVPDWSGGLCDSDDEFQVDSDEGYEMEEGSSAAQLSHSYGDDVEEDDEESRELATHEPIVAPKDESMQSMATAGVMRAIAAEVQREMAAREKNKVEKLLAALRRAADGRVEVPVEELNAVVVKAIKEDAEWKVNKTLRQGVIKSVGRAWTRSGAVYRARKRS